MQINTQQNDNRQSEIRRNKTQSKNNGANHETQKQGFKQA